MTNRHLPAGQSLPPANGPAIAQGTVLSSNHNMPAATDMPTGGGGPSGSRRRHHQYPPQHHYNQHQHHHQHHIQQQHPAQYAAPYAHHQQHMVPPQHMYAGGYGMPYGAPQGYYGMPGAQYQTNGARGVPNDPRYMQYHHQQVYPQSPPAAAGYSPMAGVTVPPSYPRHSQPMSPALATPYQPPPAPAAAAPPLPPQTPSSTQSSQAVLPPHTPSTPQLSEYSASVKPASPATSVAQKAAPFIAPLPWFSHPDESFPAWKPKSSRKKFTSSSLAVSLPVVQQEPASESNEPSEKAAAAPASSSATAGQTKDQATTQETTNIEHGQRAETTSSTPTRSTNVQEHGSVPAPVAPKDASQKAVPEVSGSEEQTTEREGSDEATTAPVPAPAPAPKPAPPTSWANLFARNAANRAAASHGDSSVSSVNGDGANGPSGTNLFPKTVTNSAGDAIHAYRVGSSGKAAYIEPRGLINTGNMCYMNSVLQVLMFCVPFYDFLNQVSQRAAHSFKSETPLIDAMIMFMHEFKVLRPHGSIEQLRQSLKAEDLDKFGEPFTPEFVYEAIRQLPRFASMRRGHQQDAEEFLGFLLQSLDDECTAVMGNSSSSDAHQAQMDASSVDGQAEVSGDWLEVGRKQKAAVSRSSGTNASTPINKIFGGFLRSEFRVPGLKDSITTEPYQPLQLDISTPDIRSVTDALRGLTKPERLQGDFNSPRGKDVLATKQVFIESLPPVLILHLKRFQFDAEGHGTVKIWKKIDYPLELEIPPQALSRQKRQALTESTMPKYQLISVVYHHGKNASGGHYTADVRRQDGQDWLRLDDTVLRRIPSDDVAETGSKEEQNKEIRNREANSNNSPGASANRFGSMNDEDDEAGDDGDWEQVTTTAGGNKRWSSVINGNGSTTPKSKQHKESVKDNKVAYLLFYQRI
ncbi:uncharacterized protein F5Z01DRAFT_558525 [Emericellopsis atlantica]|uniref:Ubiquitin carboxyl-terminal hydrolase n=1 Tax=Emericellopsis atlantica TaxID=2614577 RepID=A0A9P7ZPI5_9HYPO|nr:uncharacterized protein F5Z01DRAFT_558525 [Emericellopsis atlantica]KAG9255805.1 hypothetical protein F5Z01DRAFT_558525 [Emericellopsis atlantica]